ncbi:hypothetical protein HWV62_44532 [Athelia sp. TMB]|nr:hypothetical protein HWV62_44532 [Athelia sp. TMB]
MPPRKNQNQTYALQQRNKFISDEAAEGNGSGSDEEEEGDEEDEEFVEEDDPESFLLDHSSQRAGLVRLTRDLNPEEDDAHSRSIAAEYRKRATASRPVEVTEENRNDEFRRMVLLPPPVSIYRVKVPPGLDKFIMESICELPHIYLPKLAMHHILSVVNSSNSNGLYFETTHLANVRSAINEVWTSPIQVYSITPIPPAEIVAVLQSQHAQDSLRPHSWVRLRRGSTYKGDLAFVDSLEMDEGYANILLMPRLPSLTYRAPGRKRKRKRTNRDVLPAFFIPDEVIAAYENLEVDQVTDIRPPKALDEDTWLYNGETLYKGLCRLRVATLCLNLSPVEPSETELLQWRACTHEPIRKAIARRPSYYAHPPKFRTGDRVIIRSAERDVEPQSGSIVFLEDIRQEALCGPQEPVKNASDAAIVDVPRTVTFLTAFTALVRLDISAEIVSCPSADLEKKIRIGDSMEIHEGPYSGTLGIVLETNGDVVTLLKEDSGSVEEIEANVDNVHHAVQDKMPRPSRLQQSLQMKDLPRGPQRQNLWQGMPVTFVHGHHKGKLGYIRTAQETYPPSDPNPVLSQSYACAHECAPDCASCKDEDLTKKHTCSWRCPACQDTPKDAKRYRDSLSEFLDVNLQVDVNGTFIHASVREVRPQERWGRATIDMITCQRAVEWRWFDDTCHKFGDNIETHDTKIKAINWFNLVPYWITRQRWQEQLPTEECPWASPLPTITWSAASVMGRRELAEATREGTPMPDSPGTPNPVSDETDTPWVIDDSDRYDGPTDWLDDDLCQNSPVIFASLALGSRSWKEKPEWAGINAKIQLGANCIPIRDEVQVQLLTDKLKGKSQIQHVPRQYLVPTRPVRAGEYVVVLRGRAKGDLGRVVDIQGQRVSVCAPKAKATARNCTTYNIDDLVISKKK